MAKEFLNLLIDWNAICIRPTGNTLITSPLDKHFMDEIKEKFFNFITEDNEYYIIKYGGNTIKIEK